MRGGAGCVAGWDCCNPSHGVAKHIYDLLEKNKITCVDATCPFVKKIHKIVAEESAKGKEIIIIGNEKHPEVERDQKVV